MKKVISVLLALVFALSGLSVVAFAADESGITEFSVESVIDSGSAAIKTEWYEINGVYYIFLPKAISPALCKINFTAFERSDCLRRRMIRNLDFYPRI